MVIMIGSYAARIQGLSLQHLGDIDLIGYGEDLKLTVEGLAGVEAERVGNKWIAKGDTMIVEGEDIQEGSTTEELYNLIMADEKSILHHGITVASLDVLYMLKMTHRYKKNTPFFNKTMWDILAFRQVGAVIRDEHQAFYKRRYDETLSYGHPKLNQSKKNFFTDDVPYIYDHDTIHLAVAKLDKPAYNYYKPDENEVQCSREMFEQADETIRILGVYEEACVLALERSHIPYGDTVSEEQSFFMALEKVCTSITSGWFREFAWENYFKVVRLYRSENAAGRNYVSLFNQGVAKGIVKPHGN